MGSSLTVVAALLESTGKTRESEETYRKAETLLVELAPTIAGSAAVRAILAECRWRLGMLLHRAAGRYDEALSLYRLARADLEVLAAAPGATTEVRRSLADTVSLTGSLLDETGKTSEAEAEIRKALTLRQQLADDNPAVTEFRRRVSNSHNNLGILLHSTGKLIRRGTAGRAGGACWLLTRSWPTRTPPSRNSATTWRATTTTSG